MNLKALSGLVWLLLSVQLAFGQADSGAVQVNRWPFPVTSGWTFVDDQDPQAVYPVYDSIVIHPFHTGYGMTYMVRDSIGKYGVVSAWENIDTLQSFKYDSIFRRGDFFIGREQGTWYRWQFGALENDRRESIGSIDRWLSRGDHLYFFSGDKMGISTHVNQAIVRPKYNYIRLLYSEFDRGFHDYFLVSDGKLFGLATDEGSREIVPVVATSIQKHTFGFCRYWDGYWKYVRLSDGLLIDPKGGDVVIYGIDSWKVYNKERTRASLYLKSGATTFSGNYEDYFLLSNGTIAVRKDSLVGVIGPAGNVLFNCRFEQVDALSENRYRCLEKKLWYLADETGTILNKNGFDFIEQQPEWNEMPADGYAVHKNGKNGIIGPDGTIILQPIYNSIHKVSKGYVLDNGGWVAMADRKGKVLSGFDYVDFRDLGNVIVMLLSDMNQDLYSEFGRLNRVHFAMHLMTDGVIKCYSSGNLEMIVLDDDSLKVSERLEYPGVYSVEVGKLPEPYRLNYFRSGRNLSHLEENQLGSRFGYRKDWSAGHVATPSFREVQQGESYSYDFGIEEYEEANLAVGDGPPFIRQFTLQAVNPGTANYQGNPFSCSTIRLVSLGSSSSTNRLNFREDGGKDWWVNSADQSHNANDVVYIDYPSSDLFEYNIGGKLVVTKDNDGRISLFDYYAMFNSSGNLRLDPASIELMMDPENQLKVEGGKWFVNIDHTNSRDKIVSGLKGHYYEDIRFLNTWEGKLNSYIGKPSGAKNYTWSFTTTDSIAKQFRAVQDSGYYIVEGIESVTGLVHPDYPSFVFIASDTNTFYANGRLIARKNGKWGLNSVDGTALVPAEYEQILYLRNGLFGLKGENGWRIADRNGLQKSENRYKSLSGFDNGFAVAKDDNGWLIIDLVENPLFRSGDKEIRGDGGGFFTIRDNEKIIVFDPANAMTDTILKAEKSLGSGWIYGKNNEQRYVRRLGSTRKTVIKATGMPEVFGTGLIINRNGIYSLMDTDGKQVLPKSVKPSDFEKGERMLCFKSSKRWVFISDEGKLIHESPKGKSVSYFDHRFVIELKDSTYAIDVYGNQYAVNEAGKIAPAVKKATSAEPKKESWHIITVNGKQGVESDKGQVLVAPDHTAVLGKSGEEFLVQAPAKKGVYSNMLKEYMPVIYDEVILYNGSVMLVRQGKKYGIRLISGEWVKPFPMD